MSYFEIIARKYRKARELRREAGWRGVRMHAGALYRRFREARDYQKWIARNRMTDERRGAIRREIEALESRPLLSIVLPVYDVDEKWLRACLDSVGRQLYENWELCIADDCSPRPHVRQVLEEYAARDLRVKVVFRAANGHISAASNTALELAGGEFCVLLDHDDELAEDALFYVAREIEQRPETAFIYSDEDVIDERGRRFGPKFKPDFSRDLLYSLNLVTHLSAYRTELLRKIGGFRAGFEGSQDYDLALRFIERIDERQIRHIPRILYHWRAIRGSVALSGDEKPYAHERARAALGEHLARTGKTATVERGIYQFHRVRYALPAKRPPVSLILDAAGAETPVAAAAQRFTEATRYPDLEIVLVCAKKIEPGLLPENVRACISGERTRAARLNEAARFSAGEILCFADAELRPLSEDWLEELTGFAMQPEIGATGGKVLDESGAIVGGGLILGFDGLLGVAHRGLPHGADGGLYRARVVGDFSAVAIGCLAVRREVFDEAGGFDAENLPDALFDADFCLRIGAARGRRIVFTPHAALQYAAKRVSRAGPGAAERGFFRRKWQSVIARDPFYNPNLSLRGETFTIKL